MLHLSSGWFFFYFLFFSSPITSVELSSNTRHNPWTGLVRFWMKDAILFFFYSSTNSILEKTMGLMHPKCLKGKCCLVEWLSSAEKFQRGLWFVAVDKKAILSLFETYTFTAILGSVSFVCYQRLPSLTLVDIMVKLVWLDWRKKPCCLKFHVLYQTTLEKLNVD